MKIEKGYILVLTILVLVALFLIAVYYLGLFRNEHRVAMKSEHDIIATEAANAGIEDAIYNLRGNPNWTAGFKNVILPRANSSYSMTFTASSNTPYCTNNFAGKGPVTGYNGRLVPAGMVHLVSIGKYGLSTQVEEALVRMGSKLFKGAVNLNGELSLTGNVVIDSWNSTLGTYQQTAQKTGANIYTNLDEDDIVRLAGNVKIYGNIAVGPNGTESKTLRVTGQSTYLSFSAEAPQTLPIINPPYTSPVLGSISANGQDSVSPAPGVYYSFSGSGQSTINLSPGTYVILGDMTMSGGAKLRLPQGSDKVKIYVLGNISVTGGSFANDTLDPKKLLIYGGPNTKSFDVTGDGTAYVGLYAPAADIRITGNADLYGAVVASSLRANGNGSIHFDQSITEITEGGGVTVISRW